MRRAPGLFRPHHAKARCILHLSTKGCSNTRKVEAPAGSTTSTCASPSGSTCSASSGTKGSQAADLHVSTAAFWLSAPDVWRRACLNTTRCLIGCSVGDLSTLWLLQTYAPELHIAAAVSASCVAGITTSMCLETVVLRVTENLAWRKAWQTAAGMSLISMVSMELAENIIELYITGGLSGCGMNNSELFWQAVPPAMCAGFLTPLPYNFYMLRKYGRGCH